MAKVTSVEQSKLATSFETMRRTLLAAKQDGRLEKPLAYWALPNDRRLPLALLDQPLVKLLKLPFEEISSTPGIGQKKMGAMIKLLIRAANDKEHNVPFGLAELADNGDNLGAFGLDGFDYATVSESEWSQWVQTVVRHGLQHELLGRLAASLHDLPAVLWHRPLGFYTEYTVAQIRRLKTHGAKRVNAILQVFQEIDRLLKSVPTGGPIAARVIPQAVRKMEFWIAEVIATDVLPEVDSLRKQLIVPLLRQIKNDLSETEFKICERRVGIRGKPQGVKAQAKRLDLTRARVYQLLDDCAKVTAVRWPAGRYHLAVLAQRYESGGGSEESQRLIAAAGELFYPEKFNGEA